MQLGICTRYVRHEANYAGIRLANMARQLGIDVSIYNVGTNTPDVDPQWDKRVVTSDITTYPAWARKQTHILWTHTPDMLQFEWTLMNQIKTSVMILLHRATMFGSDDEITDAVYVMAHADKLICPSDACYKSYAESFTNCWYLPLDYGNPLYTHDADKPIDAPRILLPLWDGASRRMEMTALQLVVNTLHEFQKVTITIPYDRKVTHASVVRRLRTIQQCFPGRVTLAHSVRPSARFTYYQSHDLTLYPTQHETLALNILASLEMGTPVVAFNAMPVSEILDDDNGVCVRCFTDVHSNAYGSVVPNYDMLQLQLFTLLRDTTTLQRKQRAAYAKACARRQLFESQCTLMLQTST